MSRLNNDRSDREQTIKNFLRDHLNDPKDGQAIQKILSEAGSCYNADRAYVFEFNKKHTEFSNTYEWCKEGVPAEKDNLQHITVDGLENWFDELEKNGEFIISSLSEEYDADSKIYRLLKPQGIESLAMVPLSVNSEVIGFLGVDNPRCNVGDTLLLSVIASACCIEITNKRLEDSNKALTERMKIIQSMSEIYTSVYYIDIAENSYVELASIDSVHEQIGSTGNAQEKLDFFCRNMMSPEYTDNMLRFVDIKTLDERLSGSRIISKEFLCTVPFPPDREELPYWVQCSFIDGGRDADGRLSHAVFVTETIHDAKVRELDTQKYLQEANFELTELLKAEKKNTAIISSLSGIFFALYYVDIEEGFIQEIFSPDGVSHTCGEKDDAVSRLSSIVDYWADDEYKSAMRLFTDLGTVDRRLWDSPVITQEYYSVRKDWVRCHLIPVEKNEFGGNTKILFGFRLITAEKERLESQDNVIQALTMTYDNAYAVNTDTAEVKRFLADKQAYSFTYRVHRNDTVQYFECQLVKPGGKRNEFVIAFKNIDEEKNREFAQQRKIESALDEVRKINRTLQYEMNIAGALSKDYPNVVLLDPANDTVMTIKRNGIILKEGERTVKYSYDELCRRFISNYIPAEDRERIGAAFSLDSVLHALETDDEYMFSYRTVYDDTGIHNYQASFFRILNGEIILGLRNIDAIVEEERRNIRIMETQSEIIEGLSSVYYSVLLVYPQADIHENVIGDSLRIQKVFTNLMSNAVKYTPDGVSSGAEAVEYCTVRHQKNQDYYACIIDWKMPEMNGYEATMAIRSIQGRPDARNIPIIALTANAFVEDVQASLDAGMNGHLAKPIVMEEVIGTIARQVHK